MLQQEEGRTKKVKNTLFRNFKIAISIFMIMTIRQIHVDFISCCFYYLIEPQAALGQGQSGLSGDLTQEAVQFRNMTLKHPPTDGFDSASDYFSTVYPNPQLEVRAIPLKARFFPLFPSACPRLEFGRAGQGAGRSDGGHHRRLLCERWSSVGGVGGQGPGRLALAQVRVRTQPGPDQSCKCGCLCCGGRDQSEHCGG